MLNPMHKRLWRFGFRRQGRSPIEMVCKHEGKFSAVNETFILHIQDHGCQYPGETRNQGRVSQMYFMYYREVPATAV